MSACSYAKAMLSGYQPTQWQPGSLTGQLSLPIQNSGNISALFNVTPISCCMSQPNRVCNASLVSINGSLQQEIAPSAVLSFAFAISKHSDECPQCVPFNLPAMQPLGLPMCAQV